MIGRHLECISNPSTIALVCSITQDDDDDQEQSKKHKTKNLQLLLLLLQHRLRQWTAFIIEFDCSLARTIQVASQSWWEGFGWISALRDQPELVAITPKPKGCMSLIVFLQHRLAHPLARWCNIDVTIARKKQMRICFCYQNNPLKLAERKHSSSATRQAKQVQLKIRKSLITFMLDSGTSVFLWESEKNESRSWMNSNWKSSQGIPQIGQIVNCSSCLLLADLKPVCSLL